MNWYRKEEIERIEEEAQAKRLRVLLKGRMMPPAADIVKAQKTKWRWWHGPERLSAWKSN